ncbi:MAG: hypothetical protein GY812_07470 [Actinomycetia bacterium]|nr:hypothetical protein [Actinomycetes bacterium]
MARPTRELIRIAAALVHSTPGATLHVESTAGAGLLVGSGPSAEVTACQFRRVVLAKPTVGEPDPLEYIAGLSIGGSLEPIGGGLHRERAAGGERIVVTSQLGPVLIEQLLRGLETANVSVSGASAAIGVDHALGTCIVSIAHDNPCALHETAAVVAGTLASEEAMQFARSLERS